MHNNKQCWWGLSNTQVKSLFFFSIQKFHNILGWIFSQFIVTIWFYLNSKNVFQFRFFFYYPTTENVIILWLLESLKGNFPHMAYIYIFVVFFFVFIFVVYSKQSTNTNFIRLEYNKKFFMHWCKIKRE